MSATVEIPTGKIENIEPESVVADNPQPYEQGTDQTYDPKMSATVEQAKLRKLN